MMQWFFRIVGLLVISLFILIIAGNYLFEKKVDKQINEIFQDVPQSEGTISSADLSNLPSLIREYLNKSGLVGQPNTNVVRLRQQGKIRLDPDSSWLDFTAEQIYRLDKPAMIWNCTVRVMGIPIIRGIDVYHNAKGYMKIQIMPGITVVNATGTEINEATQGRFLNEMMWFPQMYLSDYVSFVEKDATTVEINFTDRGSASIANLLFNEEGNLVNFTSNRMFRNGDSYEERLWSTPLSSWGALSGIRIPTSGYATWELDDRSFDYIKIDIVEIDYQY